MKCPNCTKKLSEQGDKYHCEDCGWFENVDGEWHVCEAPAPEPEPEPEPTPEIKQQHEPEIKTKPEPQVKSYLGGIVTVTEVENE